jgi:hypothetical protein
MCGRVKSVRTDLCGPVAYRNVKCQHFNAVGIGKLESHNAVFVGRLQCRH